MRVLLTLAESEYEAGIKVMPMLRLSAVLERLSVSAYQLPPALTTSVLPPSIVKLFERRKITAPSSWMSG